MTVLPFEAPADVAAALPRAVAHLRRGGVLAHPTETVYGLGSRADPDGLAALADVKGRERDKPFLLLVSDRTMAERLTLTFTEAAEALARAFWPGPLTLILAGGRDLPDGVRGGAGGVAVRWTSHAGTARLVAALGEPLTSTSANVAGADPARDVPSVLARFAAPITTRESSSSWMAERRGTRRPRRWLIAPSPSRGSYAPDRSRRPRCGPSSGLNLSPMPVRKVLLVCTGNICRSPLAAALLERALGERGATIQVSSAGTGAWDGAPVSEGAYLVGLEQGLDLSGHRARLLTRDLVETSDLVLTMARHHRARVDELGGEGRVFVLGEYAGRGADAAEVSDPFGGDLEVYRRTCGELAELIAAAVDRIVAEAGHGDHR